MRMVGYGRVSTDHEEQRDSLEHQQAFFQDFARARGHTLVRVYSDQGISGKWLKKRDGFLQMLRDAERGEFELVVVKDISRFARNTVDSLESIRRLKALGIECIFVNNSLKVLGESEFIVTIMAAIAQEESANLSKRVKFGKDITSRKGRVPPRIYGYDRLDNFTLRIVPAEAEVVREIFRLYLQGLGCRKIAQALEERGASTKLGASWNSRGVRRVLENPIYCGHYVNHKYTVSDFLSGQIQRLPPDMHYHHDRPEWAIVSPDTFQEAARLMEQRRRQSGSAPPTRYSGRYPLSTLIRCQSCGRAFTRRRVAYPSGRQYVYWHCPIHSEYAGSRCGNGTILPEEGLLDQLRAWLAAQISSPAALAEAVRLRLDARSSRPAEDPAAALRRRLDQLEGQRARYLELYAGDLLSMEELRRRLWLLAERGARLREDLDRLTRDPPRDLEAEITEQVRRVLSLEDITNGELRQLIDRITVSEKGDVSIYPARPAEEPPAAPGAFVGNG